MINEDTIIDLTNLLRRLKLTKSLTHNQGIDELINTEEGKIVDIWPLILFSCPNLRYWGEQTFTEE